MKPKYTILLTAIVISLFLVNEFALHKNTGNSTVAVTAAGSSGEALVGGAFELTDQNGNKFTEQNLIGKYSLVYFGFTNCPHICPLALSNMSLALNELGGKAKDIQIVFITADPKRDTVERLKEFLGNFNAPIVGLTGTDEALAKANSAYKVYAEKLSADAKGNYDINHTSIIYIMDKNGKFVSHFNHETKVADIVKKLKDINL